MDIKRKIRLVFIIVLIFAILSFGFAFYYDHVKEEKAVLKKQYDYYNNLIHSEQAWLASLQLSNGALPFRGRYNGSAYIVPYFSSITAIALLQNTSEYKDVVADYFGWHFSHLNDAQADINGISGTIYNYNAEISDGIVQYETTDKKYDSIDSYAAFFLIALWEYYEQTEEKEYLYIHYSDIVQVTKALEATIDDQDGLSYVKPDYQVKYIMDNVEVYEGISCAINIFQHVFLPHYADNTYEKNEVQNILNRLTAINSKQMESIERKLWNVVEQRYEVGLNNVDGRLDFSGWTQFYPDAVSQLFPIIFGTIEPDNDRARSLYDKFSNHFDWENFEHHLNGDAKFYWGILAYCGALMHDEEKVKDYLDYYAKNIMKNHDYPVYNADVAWVVLACSEMANYYQDEMRKIDPLGIVTLE